MPPPVLSVFMPFYLITLTESEQQEKVATK